MNGERSRESGEEAEVSNEVNCPAKEGKVASLRSSP